MRGARCSMSRTRRAWGGYLLDDGRVQLVEVAVPPVDVPHILPASHISLHGDQVDRVRLPVFPARPWEDGRKGKLAGRGGGRGERGGRAGWRGGDQVDRVRLPVFPARPWEDGRKGKLAGRGGGGRGERGRGQGG